MQRGKRKTAGEAVTATGEDAEAPSLKTARRMEKGRGDNVLITRELECRICMGILLEPLVTECLHRFCKKCIQQHMRQYERQIHLCPLCNKEIKTSRALKPDEKVNRLIQVLHPNRVREEDISTNKSTLEGQVAAATIWMQAATIHRQKVALMKQQQRERLANDGNYVPLSMESVGMPRSSASAGRQRLQIAPLAALAHTSTSPPPGASPEIGHVGEREVEVEDETAERHREESQLQAEVQLAQIQNINSKYDPIKLADMLGIEPFQMSATVQKRIEAVSGPPVSLEGLVSIAAEKAKNRKLLFLGGSVAPQAKPMQLLCIPPIQVKFRKSLSALGNLPRVQETNISFPADATVRQMKEALSLLIKQAATDNTRKKSSARPKGDTAKHGIITTTSSSSSSSSRDGGISNDEHTPEGGSLVLSVPIPLPSAPGSCLPFCGYTVHSVGSEELTLYQINTWFEDSCASIATSPHGQQLLDLLFLYDVAASTSA